MPFEVLACEGGTRDTAATLWRSAEPLRSAARHMASHGRQSTRLGLNLLPHMPLTPYQQLMPRQVACRGNAQPAEAQSHYNSRSSAANGDSTARQLHRLMTDKLEITDQRVMTRTCSTTANF